MLLPGMLFCRLCGQRVSVLWGFVASAPILLNLILLCDVLGMPLRLDTVLAGLLVIAGVLALAVRRGRREQTAEDQPARTAQTWSLRLKGFIAERSQWPWLAGLAVAAGFLVLRLVVFPLSGWDHSFRWDFLAQQILRFRTLAFYPVHEASDHTIYLWCDGIPPLVSVQQWWTYVSLGSAAAWVSTPRVLFEGFLLALATGKLAERLGGERARLPAMVLLGCSAVALWTLTIGQETVLTALGLVALLLAFEERGLRAPWKFVFAGLAAGLGALSREYGLAWVLFGLVVLVWRREFRLGWAWFLVASLAACGPWYLRNWWLTGNPLFPHTLGGLFPGNEVHEETMRIIRSYCSPLKDPAKFAHDLFVSAPGYLAPPLIACAGMVLCRQAWRRWLPVFLGGLLVVLLWLISVPETAGGWGYSFRVLMPALALASVLGALGVSMLAERPRLGCSVLLGGLVFISGLRSLQLPTQHEPSWADCFSDRWITRGHAFDGFFVNAGWKRFLSSAEPGILVVDEPACQAALIQQGAPCTLSLFSPELRFLFDEKLAFEEQLRRLRSLHVRYVILSPGNTISDTRAGLHHFFGELQQKCNPDRQIGFNLVYDILALKVASGAP